MMMSLIMFLVCCSVDTQGLEASLPRVQSHLFLLQRIRLPSPRVRESRLLQRLAALYGHEID